MMIACNIFNLPVRLPLQKKIEKKLPHLVYHSLKFNVTCTSL